jgi:hypothetical protein
LTVLAVFSWANAAELIANKAAAAPARVIESFGMGFLLLAACMLPLAGNGRGRCPFLPSSGDRPDFVR